MDQFALAVQQEFFKVPLDLASASGFSTLTGQILIQGAA